MPVEEAPQTASMSFRVGLERTLAEARTPETQRAILETLTKALEDLENAIVLATQWKEGSDGAEGRDRQLLHEAVLAYARAHRHCAPQIGTDRPKTPAELLLECLCEHLGRRPSIKAIGGRHGAPSASITPLQFIMDINKMLQADADYLPPTSPIAATNTWRDQLTLLRAIDAALKHEHQARERLDPDDAASERAKAGFALARACEVCSRHGEEGQRIADRLPPHLQFEPWVRFDAPRLSLDEVQALLHDKLAKLSSVPTATHGKLLHLLGKVLERVWRLLGGGA